MSCGDFEESGGAFVSITLALFDEFVDKRLVKIAEHAVRPLVERQFGGDEIIGVGVDDAFRYRGVWAAGERVDEPAQRGAARERVAVERCEFFEIAPERQPAR